MFGFGGGNRVHVRITGDEKDLGQSLDKSEREIQGFGKRASTSMKGASSSIVAGFKVAAVAAIGAFVAKATEAASALEESTNAIEKVFGDASSTIEAFGDVSASVAGLSKREFNELSSVTGALLKNVGFSADEAASKTVQLTTRAADMASVFNTDVGTALEAINSALKGERDPIEQFGVKLNDATVKAKAVEMGLADTTAAVDDHMKAQASLALIMEQTSNVAGDFAQTTDGLANSQRVAAARAENAAAKFGRAWTPIFADIVGFAGDTLLSFQALGGSETAKMELRVSEALKGIQDAAANGGDKLTALADGMLHVAREGELTTGTFQAMAAQAGLMPEQFDAFKEAILEQAEAAGVDQEEIDELAGAIDDAQQPTEDLEAATGELADTEEDHAEKTRDAIKAMAEKREALRDVHDPLFKVTRLQQDLLEAEEAVAKAEKEYGRDSPEFREAVMGRAEIVADLQDTLRELKEQGIDPTGAAARTMLQDMGVPDDVIDEIFSQFDDLERNLEDRTWRIRPELEIPKGVSGGGPFHTGGRVNAPKGVEVPIMALGGEEITNPDHDGDHGAPVRAGPSKVEHHWHITQSMDPRDVFDYAAWKMRTAGI